MEYNHVQKLIDSYQMLATMMGKTDEPNQQLFDLVFEMYEFAYDAGCHETSERVHFFYPEMIDKKELLIMCHEGKRMNVEVDEGGNNKE